MQGFHTFDVRRLRLSRRAVFAGDLVQFCARKQHCHDRIGLIPPTQAADG